MKATLLDDPSPIHRSARTITLILTLAVASAALLSCPGAVTGGPVAPVPASLAGPRYETMRALARYLDTTAQGALEGALDDARHGPSSDGKFLFPIRAFAAAAAAFDERVEKYPGAPFEIPSQVAKLAARARGIDQDLRAAHALESTYDEWEGVMDVLGRMTALLGGKEVEVPAAYLVPVLSGAPLEQFRQLAHDLQIVATRQHARARRDVGRYPRGEQFLGELDYFAGQSRDLHLRADAGAVGPQEMGPIVDRLLEAARAADRRMRDAQAFPEVWDDSGRAITILYRMATLVRS